MFTYKLMPYQIFYTSIYYDENAAPYRLWIYLNDKPYMRTDVWTKESNEAKQQAELFLLQTKVNGIWFSRN